jgi:hypothetical protein
MPYLPVDESAESAESEIVHWETGETIHNYIIR